MNLGRVMCLLRLKLPRAIVVWIVCLGFMSTAQAIDLDTQLNFHIAPQKLTTAIVELSRQIGAPVVSDAKEVAGFDSPGVNGKMPLREALRALLVGTSLEFKMTDSGAIAIGHLTRSPARLDASRAETQLPLARTNEPIGGDAATAAGNPPGAQTRELDEVVVTGTHLRGVSRSASPIVRYLREDLERSGYSTLDQFIQSVPQNFGGGASQDSVGTDGSAGNDGYGSAVNLRGLGPGTSLVLLNGRRLAPGGNSGEFVDVSMIPLAAIERVEILTDGASAIYGSDAVGGVLNIILRDNYEGAQTSVRYGGVSDGHLSERQVSQSAGDNWGEGGALLAYEYYGRDALEAQDRSFAREFTSQLPRTLLPEQKRHSLYANVHQDVSQRVSVHGDLLYSHRDSDNHLAYLAQLVHEQARNEQIQASLGSSIQINTNWKAQLNGTFSRYRLSARRFETAADTGDQTALTNHVNSRVWSLDAQADGALMRMSGGDLRLAVGGNYRTENILPVLGYSLPERHVRAAFGELFVPFVGKDNRVAGMEALELSLAARYEEYNDYGSDVTPKFGLRWEPVSGLSLRGTYGRSFKAPALVQLAGGTESLIAFIPSDFGISISGDPLILLRTQAAHPSLRAEKSRSWTAGFDFEPHPGALSLSMSYYRIHFTDRIDVPTEAGFAEFFNSPQGFSNFIVSNPSAAFVNARLAAATDFLDLSGGAFRPDAVGIWADDALTNIASETQSGIDLSIRQPLETRWGRIDFSLNGTYITSFQKKAAPAAPALEALNRLYEPLELRMRGGIAWSRGNLSTALFANYQNGYRNIDPNWSHIASWTSFDAQLRYDFGKHPVSSALQGLTLTASVQNLFDRNPPFVADSGSPIANPGYDPTNANPLGRFMALQVAKAW